MTDDAGKGRSQEYKVGYRNPPKSGQFKKGQSANPAGRPRKSKNKETKLVNELRGIVLAEGYREVTIQDKDGPKSIPVVQAAMRSLGLKAAQGNTQAQKQFLSVVSRAEADEQKERAETFGKMVKYKEEKLAEIENYRKLGKKPPRMLPHPDHIEINYETLEVTFHGPISKDDLAVWERLHGVIKQLGEETRGFLLELDELEKGDEWADRIKEEIEEHQHIIMTASLSIARRWKLPLHRVLSRYVPMFELKRHLDNGTDPTPPKAYKEIVRRMGDRGV